MQTLGIVGYTADLSHLVFVDTSTGERFKAPLTDDLIRTITEVLSKHPDDPRLQVLGDVLPSVVTSGRATALGGAGVTSAAGNSAATRTEGLDGRPASAAAALLALGPAVAGASPSPKLDGSASKLTPSEIQRMLRAGKAPETVAEQAGVSLAWVMRWFQPIAAEQRKVISSVRGGRQVRDGFGTSHDLIGEAVRNNLLSRGLEGDEEEVAWTAARPEGRPYWTVTLRFTEEDRVRKATWRYDIGTGTVTARDDLAIDLGWTTPITHPAPGRMHPPGGEEPARPVQRAAPAPPQVRAQATWAPPTPPGRRTAR